MADTMTSQNINLSSWDTLYMYIYIYVLACQNGLMKHIQVFREALRYFIFSFPCITTQLLQSESNNAHSCINATMLQHTSSFMFRNV
jgi:hypothetical protein